MPSHIKISCAIDLKGAFRDSLLKRCVANHGVINGAFTDKIWSVTAKGIAMNEALCDVNKMAAEE